MKGSSGTVVGFRRLRARLLEWAAVRLARLAGWAGREAARARVTVTPTPPVGARDRDYRELVHQRFGHRGTGIGTEAPPRAFGVPPEHWLAVVRGRAPELLEGGGIGGQTPRPASGPAFDLAPPHAAPFPPDLGAPASRGVAALTFPPVDRRTPRSPLRFSERERRSRIEPAESPPVTPAAPRPMPRLAAAVRRARIGATAWCERIVELRRPTEEPADTPAASRRRRPTDAPADTPAARRPATDAPSDGGRPRRAAAVPPFDAAPTEDPWPALPDDEPLWTPPAAMPDPHLAELDREQMGV